MRCDALGAERPLETTSETVILPPPASGNTAVQKRARKLLNLLVAAEKFAADAQPSFGRSSYKEDKNSHKLKRR